MELYKRIKKRREELGMSQDELAQKLGYKSRSTIAKIEKGENDITQSKIAAFAQALQTTPGNLMGLDSEDTSTISPAAQKYQILLNLTPDLSEAVELYTSLDDGDRGVIRGEMKGMLMNPKYTTPTLKELPAQFDIAASGLDENTEAGKDNMDIINKRIEELRRK